MPQPCSPQGTEPLSRAGSGRDALDVSSAAGFECAHPSSALVGNDDGSECAPIDPALGKLVEMVTRRIQASEYPAWAAILREVLPAVRDLAELGTTATASGLEAEAGAAESDGRRVFGDFRIVREVGRGGMGIVYEAEQIALGRRVALKVLPIAIAMDRRALVRFQLEARVAGWLQHPRIVPVYAVGQRDDVPFYAMRFIEGGSLADLIAELRGIVGAGVDSRPPSEIKALAGGLLSGRFAPARGNAEATVDRSEVSTDRDRPRAPAIVPSIETSSYLRTVARLGMQAAEALGYAHDQGVVHRDIKPANLLLDRGGDLWVADFGMADVQGGAGLTLTGDLPGTLRYMSPEQAQGNRALVDRRTDIYSLGATLYELMSLRAAVAGEDRPEIFRRIVDEEPPPLRRINRSVPVDLATIVAKSLSKDPSSRYGTAWHLAADLGRFLDGLPIAARPAGPLARSWRWCRRKPLLAGLAASLALALVVGFAGIMWSWREAVHQRELLLVAEKEARTQAAKADAINGFLIEKLLNQASPEHNPAASKVTLLEVLDRAAAEVGSSFSAQPATEAALRLAIGRTYHGLGEYAKSAQHLRAAFEILNPKTGDPGRLEAMCELGHNLCHLAKLDEAEPLLTTAAAESTATWGPGHPTALLSAEYLAELQAARGRFAEAERTYRRYLAEARHARKPDQEVIMTAVNNLGLVLPRLGKIDEAEGLYRQLVEESRLKRGPKHPGTLSVINNLATLLEKRKKYTEAEHLFRECLKLNREVLGPRHPGTLALQYNLAYVLKGQRRFDEAEALFREHLAAQIATAGPDHPSTFIAMGGLGSLLQGRGKLDEAEPMIRACLSAQTRVLGASHPDTLRTASRLKSIQAARQKPGGARPPNVAGLAPH
jgi:serine/threonine-protein kinase